MSVIFVQRWPTDSYFKGTHRQLKEDRRRQAVQGSSPEGYVQWTQGAQGRSSLLCFRKTGCTEASNTAHQSLVYAKQCRLTWQIIHPMGLILTVCLSHLTAQNSDFLLFWDFLRFGTPAPSLSLILCRLMTQRSQMGHTCLYVSEEKGFKELTTLWDQIPGLQPGSKVCLRPPWAETDLQPFV